MKFKIFLKVIAVLVIVLSIFPFIPVDYWWVRSFDFPHIQLTLLTLITLLIYFIRFDVKSKYDSFVIISLSLCFILQLNKIYPYTFFAEYEVLPSEKVQNHTTLGIYTANVFQDNKNNQDLFRSIKKRNPDIILLTETDQRWRSLLKKEFFKDYQYYVEAPFENTYGMFLLSKYELLDSKVEFLVEDTIPSIHAKVKTSNGDLIQLISIHPSPPVPTHNASSVDRDSEMMQVAKLSRESKYPTIVMGDFNDVAWSETTELFQEVSGLLDMRKGRGFYNTYNAHNPLLRWPLDHIFVSPQFRVLEIEKAEYFDSDHFPFYTKLSFEPDTANKQKLDPATKEELLRAEKEIENAEEKS
ncbi:endonuclease/exonuclease/phosphatase family protein [uncultured Dokdonia sp.]|uniref:endonuclease/exonuclease/phosphatase family protein n=1 Tax=uncultured Dokdonia sp. TaxID=575653 RepID=UPI002610BF44|nr:endonuclease/exonuclease/phosphatase family protein [uncultured Dokdonia sp.]